MNEVAFKSSSVSNPTTSGFIILLLHCQLSTTLAMNRHKETNPHFARPSPRPPGATDSRDRRQRPRQDGRSGQRRGEETHTILPAPIPTLIPHTPMAPLHVHHPDEQPHLEPPRGHPEDHIIPRRGWTVPPAAHKEDPYRPKWHDRAEQPDHRNRHDGRSETHALLPAPAPMTTPSPAPQQKPQASSAHEEDPYRPKWHDRTEQPNRQNNNHHHRHGLHMPHPRKTRPLTWFLAVFCTVFWILVILGGLIVLTVYLVLRPRSPRFEVSAASLNAAYLDMGYLLNADVTLLANFTNPNRKVGVEFSYMYMELRYGRTLVATQYLNAFSAPRGSRRFADVHMVTSQVRLSEVEVQRMKRQMLSNRVVFEVKGFFRAKSSFGGLMRYSYWLHPRCTIVMTRPPGGVLVARRCEPKN